MKGIYLKMGEKKKYDVIKKLVETNGNKKRASVELGLTIRQINRLIAGYKAYGKEFFVHGNRGKVPANKTSFESKQKIVELYTSKYFDCNFTFFAELLKIHENINVSVSFLRQLLNSEYIFSPKTHKSVKRRVINELKQIQKKSKSQKEIKEIQSTIVTLENAHPTQPRSAYFGEELQMDASDHLWFGDKKCSLHIAIDDATSQIVGAYFDYAETLNGYYQITKQILMKYGIPYLIKTDRRTVFEYKKKSAPLDEDDTFTQYSYACSQLGIQIESCSTPEFKARVERTFGTLQSRLPIELRLAGVTTIEKANEYLNQYIDKFNKQFALCINNTKSVFDNQVEEARIDLILSVLSQRVINSGHSIKYKNRTYKTLDKNGNEIFYGKGTKCLVIETFNNQLYASIDNKIYALEEILERYDKSLNFDETEEIKPIKRKIPNMKHVWRRKSFEQFIEKQKHRQEKDVA